MFYNVKNEENALEISIVNSFMGQGTYDGRGSGPTGEGGNTFFGL